MRETHIQIGLQFLICISRLVVIYGTEPFFFGIFRKKL